MAYFFAKFDKSIKIAYNVFMDTQKIVQRLIEAKQAYYDDIPVMTDEEFDALEDELREADPNNVYFKSVGIGNNKNKIKHDIPMLSAGKAKTVDEVEVWRKKIGAEKLELQAEPKIDGLSATLKYKNRKLSYVSTRGDGEIGQDISHIRKYVKDILPSIKCKDHIEVRGELFIPKNSKVDNPDNKPLRNIAVGFVNRKDHGLEDLKFIRFVAYQVVGDISFDTEHEKLQWLETQGFNTIPSNLLVTSKDDLDKLREYYLSELREKWEYETDGLIFVVNDIGQHDRIDRLYTVDHNHHYNIALKPPAEGKTTQLTDIEWNVSRQGKIIPTALFKTVVIGGANISRCTLNNFENVEKLHLCPGDDIFVQLANMIIPFFAKNNSVHESTCNSLIPSLCPSCQSRLDIEGVHLVCKNKNCKEQQILKIVHWVENCEMEFFSESSVRSLFNAGKIKNVRDLYNLKESDFAGLDGFGSRKAANALNQIQETKTMTIAEFIDRLGIDLVGEKAVKKLGIKTANDLRNHSDTTYVIGRNLKDYMDNNRAFVDDLLSVVAIKTIQEAAVDAKRVCMTGKGPMTRNELIEQIAAKGDVFVDRVAKDTEILICEDVNGGSSKLDKARKMGVQLMSYEEYFG